MVVGDELPVELPLIEPDVEPLELGELGDVVLGELLGELVEPELLLPLTPEDEELSDLLK